MKGKKPDYSTLKIVETAPGIRTFDLKPPTQPPISMPMGASKPWVPPGGRAPQPDMKVSDPKTPKMAKGPGYDDPNGFVNSGNPKGFHALK